MRLGEVGLLTNDIIALVDFYKALLETENGSKDEVHRQQDKPIRRRYGMPPDFADRGF